MAVGKNEIALELGKHFLIIDSNKGFMLEDNQGFRAYRPAGAWQIDCWKLLPEQWHKIYPVYTLKIEWENSEADKDYIPAINATDLDLGDGIAGVSGQPVNITTPVTVSNLPNLVVGEQNTVPASIVPNSQPLEVVSHANNVIDGFEFAYKENLNSFAFIDFLVDFFKLVSEEVKFVNCPLFLCYFGNVGSLKKFYKPDLVRILYTHNSSVNEVAFDLYFVGKDSVSVSIKTGISGPQGALFLKKDFIK